MQQDHYLVPRQREGLKKDISYGAVAGTTDEAEDWFVDAKERLWHVNDWEQNSPGVNVQFRLTDSHGNLVNRRSRKNDHIRIELLEPGTGQGMGFDWVVIEAIEYDDYPDTNMETFAIHVRPSASPVNMRSADVGAVITSEATSTLVIERKDRHLRAIYHGRNESGDMDSEAPNDTNTITGAWLGLTGEQWECLLKGILEPA